MASYTLGTVTPFPMPVDFELLTTEGDVIHRADCGDDTVTYEYSDNTRVAKIVSASAPGYTAVITNQISENINTDSVMSVFSVAFTRINQLHAYTDASAGTPIYAWTNSSLGTVYTMSELPSAGDTTYNSSGEVITSIDDLDWTTTGGITSASAEEIKIYGEIN